MPLIPLDDIDDPRIAAYRRLRDRDVSKTHGVFVVEGKFLTERLLASRYETHSLLVSERLTEQYATTANAGINVYSVSDQLIKSIVGFDFHRGVMAAGVRTPLPTLQSFMTDDANLRPDMTLTILPELNNIENLGSLVRISAAFGVDAVLLGERCSDPFYRRSIRVSMGTTLYVPIVQSNNLLDDLTQLRDRWQFELIATVLDDEAQPLPTTSRPTPPNPNRVGILLGQETGLIPRWINACQHKVTIPMHCGTDSLNVAAAGSVFLYHYTTAALPTTHHKPS